MRYQWLSQAYIVHTLYRIPKKFQNFKIFQNFKKFLNPRAGGPWGDKGFSGWYDIWYRFWRVIFSIYNIAWSFRRWCSSSSACCWHTLLAHFWVSECCLTPKWAICHLYHGENKLHSMRWWRIPLCTRPTRLVGPLAHWYSSPRVDMSLHSDTLTWFRVHQYLLLFLDVACKYQYFSFRFRPTP